MRSASAEHRWYSTLDFLIVRLQLFEGFSKAGMVEANEVAVPVGQDPNHLFISINAFEINELG
jgi:hypothetical protein